MTDSSRPPHVPTDKPPSLADIVTDLRTVLKAGLPITPAMTIPALLSMRGVWARAVDPTDLLARYDAADRLVRRKLKLVAVAKIDRPEMPEAAQQLFGMAGSRGKDLTKRREDACATAGYEFDHFRKRIEPKIVDQLAWLLHQDSLQYVPRARKHPPPEASGDTPIIEEEDLADPERAEHEILLSWIWSEVYALRAGLIEREVWRGKGYADRVDAAQAEAELHLGRLLNWLDDYLAKYGERILHGEAEFNAEALVRLAGWTGELTEKEARDLRWRARRKNTD